MKTPNIHPILAAVICGLILSAEFVRAASLITPTAARRAVGANATVASSPLATNATAAGYVPFDRTVHLGSGGFEPWYLDASQQSAITASSITATGMVVQGFANALVSGRVTNEFRVTFRLASPATFTLGGTLVWDGLYGAGISPEPVVRLTGPGGAVFQTGLVPNDATPVDLTTNGILAAGIYTLEAYLGAASDFAGGETMNYDLAFNAAAIAPPVLNTTVYQLNATLTGVNDFGAPPTRLTSAGLVNLALNLPATNVSKTKLLALVTDGLDHSARIAVWDAAVTNIVAEVAPIAFDSTQVDLTNFNAIAQAPFNAVGRILDVNDGIPSRIGFYATGRTDTNANIIRLTSSGALGQLTTVSDTGATNFTLIRAGNLSLGKKIGALP